ncbi:hypothetical protein BDM02DRAFT_272969 [Thelephora ganbajun]|uniref:Uncharacterized protein n=1 Tax=Thelephora ganbajun TaxID=370292 RepID=A0ACB6Z9H0_THEGA|nr:hypothetical protein BDM02DRAFT_272969 [Thelephora ganbajun]
MGPEELKHATLILFGVVIWDYLTSLWFEYRVLTKKIQFRWPFVPYLLARYLVLAYIMLYSIGVFVDFTAFPLCTRTAFLNAGFILGVLAIVFSTWNLLTRTIIIWGHHPLVMKVLLAVGLVHLVISLILASIARPPCTPTLPSVLTIVMFGVMTVTIEFAILVLSLIGIKRASRHRESHLALTLKGQGVVYFAMVLFIHVAVIITSFVPVDVFAGTLIGILGTVLASLLSCRLVTSTLSQNSIACVSFLCVTMFPHGVSQ